MIISCVAYTNPFCLNTCFQQVFYHIKEHLNLISFVFVFFFNPHWVHSALQRRDLVWSSFAVLKLICKASRQPWTEWISNKTKEVARENKEQWQHKNNAYGLCLHPFNITALPNNNCEWLNRYGVRGWREWTSLPGAPLVIWTSLIVCFILT